MEDELDPTNVGYQMLKKMAWKEGEGLGKRKSGIVEPICVRAPEGREGLGRRERDESALEQATKRKRGVNESVDERKAERLETIKAEVRAQNAEFYCKVCDKQYKTVAEFSTHLSSYDHHHRKRFAEMRANEKSRGDADRDRRQEKRQEQRELDRRIEAAAKQNIAVDASSHAAAPVAASRGVIKFGFKKR